MITNAELVKLKLQGMTYPQISEATGLKVGQVRSRIRWQQTKTQAAAQPPRLKASPYPRYDQPLTVTGDALILDDLEVPFHHADFVNRCLDLAEAWQIPNLILGGDVFHMDTFSAWGAAWQQEAPQVDTISEATESELRKFAASLPPEQQGPYLEQLNRLSANRDCQDDEIRAGAKALKTLAQVFPWIGYVLGNHDDRFLRKLQSPMTPQKLLDYLGLNEPCFHIQPYFYGVLNSGGEKWRIEHQRSAAANTAVKMADKNEAHTIAAHNHIQNMQWSTSGRYWAICSGCACDEALFAYASQRSNNSPAHKLGAVIVRDGYPFILSDRTPWDRFAKM